MVARPRQIVWMGLLPATSIKLNGQRMKVQGRSVQIDKFFSCGRGHTEFKEAVLSSRYLALMLVFMVPGLWEHVHAAWACAKQEEQLS